jgi:hypothetical protein
MKNIACATIALMALISNICRGQVGGKIAIQGSVVVPTSLGQSERTSAPLVSVISEPGDVLLTYFKTYAGDNAYIVTVVYK